jgi:hypothetical protein
MLKSNPERGQVVAYQPNALKSGGSSARLADNYDCGAVLCYNRAMTNLDDK